MEITDRRILFGIQNSDISYLLISQVSEDGIIEVLEMVSLYNVGEYYIGRAIDRPTFVKCFTTTTHAGDIWLPKADNTSQAITRTGRIDVLPVGSTIRKWPTVDEELMEIARFRFGQSLPADFRTIGNKRIPLRGFELIRFTGAPILYGIFIPPIKKGFRVEFVRNLDFLEDVGLWASAGQAFLIEGEPERASKNFRRALDQVADMPGLEQIQASILLGMADAQEQQPAIPKGQSNQLRMRAYRLMGLSKPEIYIPNKTIVAGKSLSLKITVRNPSSHASYLDTQVIWYCPALKIYRKLEFGDVLSTKSQTRVEKLGAFHDRGRYDVRITVLFTSSVGRVHRFAFSDSLEITQTDLYEMKQSVAIPLEPSFSEERSSIAQDHQHKLGKEIFISYAWGGESEKIVNELDQAFQSRGVTIVRDKRDLGYRGRIESFMKTIGQGKCVILVISEEFLKSEYCMYELLLVARYGEFADRIFPIVLEDARIFKPEERLQYITYWEKRTENLKKELQGVSPTNLPGIHKDIDLLTEIRANFDRLVDVIRDINTLTPQVHKASDFSELYETITKKLIE